MSKLHVRQTTYWLISLVIMLTYYPLSNIDVLVPAEAHTLIESTASLIALFIGIMSLVRFYSNRSARYLILGAGFIGIAALDGTNTILNSSWIQADLTTATSSTSSLSYLGSQLLLSFIFLAIFLAAYKNIERISKIELTKLSTGYTAIYLIAFIFVLVALTITSRYFENSILYKTSQYIPGLVL